MVTQASLFTQSSQQITLEDGNCQFVQEFMQPVEGHELFNFLMHTLNWRQETLVLFGKRVKTPRLSYWMGDAGLSYRYSNMTMKAEPWLSELKIITQQINEASEQQFNSVLINLYRDGQDSNGWHADNEPELGADPTIASLSLGATRDFQLKHRYNPQLKFSLALTHGSLLIMGKGMQTHWLHQIPKRANAEPRINLTFRTVLT